MPRYIVLYRARAPSRSGFTSATPQEAALGLQAWVDWAHKLGSALVDPGKPLGNPMRVTPDGVQSTESDIIGMSILQATSMHDALAMTKDHHHLTWAPSCDILVLEEVPIPELQDAP
jgi:hypothetical protein